MNMENTLCQLENHLNKQAKDVTLFLVPHHGSVNNFNSKVFERFPNIRVAVISAGMINSYGHPSPEVIRHIVDKGICPIWCDEDHKVTFRQFVYY
jgi:beta-lactamase superfamily II metal-dependent hydrolase